MSELPADARDDLERLLIESVRDEAIFALDSGGRVVRWSAGAELIVGYPEAEVLGKHISIFYPPEDAALGAPGRELRRATVEGRYSAEGWQLRKDDTRFWAAISTTRLVDSAGVHVGFARIVRDTTARLRAEEALRFSEAKFSGIVSIASEAIVSIDEAHRIVLFNQGAEQIFGYTAAEVIGQPLNILLPERYHRSHEEHIRRFAESPVIARRMGERGEAHIVGLRKGGDVFPAEASISKLEIAGQRLYTAVLRDITERTRIQQELAELLERERAARAEAEAAAQARDDVLRIVSHDLGNSLSGILVTSRVLLKTIPPGEIGDETRARIESIRHLAEQMQRLRQDLLDVTRIEAGQLSIVAERHDPAALVESVYQDFAPVAEDAGLRLCVAVAPDLPTVLADRERLMQVFANLVTNAVKFTPEGGVIELGAAASEGSVTFRVTDSGTGIPAEDLPHVFDRFWQAKSANRAGAGLGLAIAKGIVEAHDGTMWVDSEVGRGSTFAFTLPEA